MTANARSRFPAELVVTARPGLGELVIRGFLRDVRRGRLAVLTPSGARIEHGERGEEPAAVVDVARWRAVRRLLLSGGLGFADGYIAGDWSSPDLTAVLELAASNAGEMNDVIAGFGAVRLLDQLRHRMNANSRAGSRRNIAFHYDLGNAFYRPWLDASMTYSSALYRDADESLEAAQTRKLARILELLALAPGSRVLEIGCGWGALAALIAKAAAHVTGLTLSTEQIARAKDRMAEEGVADRVDIRLEDYRDVRGSYDRIVSIEMLEAVGERYWPAYFSTLRARLAPGGRAVLQAITIDEARFETYRQSCDFIQRHIFPGGMLPTKSIIARQAAEAGLRLLSPETFGRSYALTLAEWRRRFQAAWPAIESLGFPPSFRRLWDYYLSYCEAGFRAGTLDVGLYVLEG